MTIARSQPEEPHARDLRAGVTRVERAAGVLGPGPVCTSTGTSPASVLDSAWNQAKQILVRQGVALVAERPLVKAASKGRPLAHPVASTDQSAISTVPG